MPRAVGRVIVLVALTVLTAFGCAPLSTFQSPSVLESGERAIGGGVLLVQWDLDYPEDRGLFPSLWYRSAVGDNTDVGVKLGLYEGALLDVKHTFLRRPLVLAGDLGVALVGLEDASSVVIRPAVLLGIENVYGGVWTHYPLSGEHWDRMSGFMVGATLGAKRKLLLEYNWFKEEGARDASMSFGLGVQGQFGK